jgi:hypothetical protein
MVHPPEFDTEQLASALGDQESQVLRQLPPDVVDNAMMAKGFFSCISDWVSAHLPAVPFHVPKVYKIINPRHIIHAMWINLS